MPGYAHTRTGGAQAFALKYAPALEAPAKGRVVRAPLQARGHLQHRPQSREVQSGSQQLEEALRDPGLEGVVGSLGQQGKQPRSATCWCLRRPVQTSNATSEVMRSS